jgi:alkylation response protein AidB-like acyl-CoA dehydrogenase
MNLQLTSDQRAIQETFASMFERESSIERVRAAESTGFDSSLWELLGSLGAIGIAVPAERGGAGTGFVELVLLATELGRRLAPVPLVEAAVVAGTVAAESGPVDLLDRVMSGEIVATLATAAARDGIVANVPGGAVAGLVLARDGDTLVAVEAPPGPRLPDLGGLALADVDLRASGAVRHTLAEGPDAAAAFERALAWWRLGIGAALNGLAHEAIRIGVAYVRDRRQFGVPVGAFQAVQHGFADVATKTEGAQLLTRKAAWSADEGDGRWPLLAAMSSANAAEVAQQAAAASLHYHGGYGFTLEYDIQLYLRRAKGWALALGDIDEQWQAIGDQHLALAGRN